MGQMVSELFIALKNKSDTFFVSGCWTWVIRAFILPNTLNTMRTLINIQ